MYRGVKNKKVLKEAFSSLPSSHDPKSSGLEQPG